MHPSWPLRIVAAAIDVSENGKGNDDKMQNCYNILWSKNTWNLGACAYLHVNTTDCESNM